MSETASSDKSVVRPLLWAVFLGSSWTWVIGMFLPVLLVRDYGVWGWIVFAVPNVVGAAAMAWVLRDAAASERFVQRHAGACYAFSLVTIAYHVFFAMWMIERLRGWGLIALGVFILAALVPGKDPLRWAGAVIALGISFAIWRMLHQQGMLAVPTTPVSPTGGGGAALLLPAFIFGFALCPYLDLTFHRARQATSPGDGRFAFGFGFGAVFLSMIAMTLLYARWIAPAAAGYPLGPLGTTYLCVHLIAQSAFTVYAHVRELPPGSAFANQNAARFAGLSALLVLLGAAAIGWIASTPRSLGARDFGEVVYWCFLGFYGLVFPGYLWLSGFSGRDQRSAAAKRARIVLMSSVVLAFPMYWMAFVEHRPMWLLPGVAIVLASRLFVQREPPVPGRNGD